MDTGWIRDATVQHRHAPRPCPRQQGVKATTLHSFKGWETRLLVIYVDAATDPKALALVYAGLTRLKRHTEGSWLTVVCSARELDKFGQNWPSYARPAVRRTTPSFGGG